MGCFGEKILRLTRSVLNRSRGRALSTTNTCSDSSILVKVSLNSSGAEADAALENGEVLNADLTGRWHDMISSSYSEYLRVALGKADR